MEDESGMEWIVVGSKSGIFDDDQKGGGMLGVGGWWRR